MALPDRPWVRHLFAPTEYPYQFQSRRELASLLDYLLDHQEEGRRRLAPIRKLIRERHGEEAWLRGWREVFEAVAAWQRRHAVVPLTDFRKQVDHLLEGSDTLGWQTALRAVKKTLSVKSAFYSNYARWLAVRDLDDYSAPLPVLRRSEVAA